MGGKDIVVLGFSAVLLLGNFAAVGTSGRARAKRAVCLANLRQLTSAWNLYADVNDERIVNGAGGFHYLANGSSTDNGSNPDVVERAWVGRAWSNNWNSANVAETGLTEVQERRALREGALWPFVGDERCYRCPVARPWEFVNYSIVDAMNGANASSARYGVSTLGNRITAVGTRIGDTVLWIKRRTEIISPNAAERMVFVDEGALTPGSFSAHYVRGPWWDDPPVRHSDGAAVSWADGHASHLRWSAAETIEFGRASPDFYRGGFTPRTPEGIEDLDGFRRAVWGRLGYERAE